MRARSTKLRLSWPLALPCLLLLAGAGLGQAPAFADPTNPDFVPPEITLPMSGGVSPQPAPQGQGGQAVPGQNTTNGQGYPGFTMPGNLGGAPGLGGAQLNPFLMKGADRLRQPPGTQFYSKGMTAPPSAGQQAGGPPMGSSAYPPGSPQGGQQATLSTEAKMADPTAVIATNKGNITIMLFKEYAPRNVAAFIQMVHQGFYNGLIWHRVEPGFVIQGGCPHGDGSGFYIPAGSNQPRYLPLEVSPKVSHNAAGVVAMARLPGNPNSGSCQFYITLHAQPKLDGQYTIIGGVTSGMEVVNRITKGDQIMSITCSE